MPTTEQTTAFIRDQYTRASVRGLDGKWYVYFPTRHNYDGTVRKAAAHRYNTWDEAIAAAIDFFRRENNKYMMYRA